MNERIKELARQAGLIAPYGSDREGLSDFDYREFAELIVRECLGIVHDAERGGSNEIWDNAVKFIRRDLQEHFGVEEQEKVAPKPKCSVCGTTENVKYMGGYQPYLCDSIDCIPF